MSAFDRIERRLPDLMDELGAARIPDYFDDMLQAVAETRQRPFWSPSERWLPMGVIARTRTFRSPTLRPILILVAVALLVAAALAVGSVASRRHVPAPFGNANNGAMFYHRPDGAIYAADPASGQAHVVVPASSTFEYPLVSRDGQRIVYDHTDNGVTTLYVADVDGSGAHSLAGTYTGFTWTEWSPDGREIGIVSTAATGRPMISILAADGSATRTVPIDEAVKLFFWLPDGKLLVMAGETGGARCLPDDGSGCALWTIEPSGRDQTLVLPTADFHGLSLSVSADGHTLLYVRWTDDEPGRLHLFDLQSKQDTAVSVTNLDAVENANIAEFSPDGQWILFDRLGETESHFGVVAVTGGPAVNVGPAWVVEGPEGHFSPDGTSIVAFYPALGATGQLWLLDPTGQGADRRLDLPATYAPVWQRTAP